MNRKRTIHTLSRAGLSPSKKPPFLRLTSAFVDESEKGTVQLVVPSVNARYMVPREWFPLLAGEARVKFAADFDSREKGVWMEKQGPSQWGVTRADAFALPVLTVTISQELYEQWADEDGALTA